MVDGAVEVDTDMGLAWVVVGGVVPGIKLDTEGGSDSCVPDALSDASEGTVDGLDDEDESVCAAFGVAVED